MTQEEKIRELVRLHRGTMTDSQYLQMQYALEEIAEWKDEQFAKKRKELIAKANQAVTESHESGAIWMKERLIEKMEDFVKRLYLPAYSYKDRENEELINDIKEAMMEG